MIIDAVGKQVKVHALVLMNYVTPGERPPRPLTITDYDNIANWGFNAVRLNFSWRHLEPTAPDGSIHHWNQRYLQALDEAVSEFTERHVAVIMDFYQFGWFPQMPAWLYPTRIPFFQAQCGFVTNRSDPSVPFSPQEGAIEVWRLIAGRYADNPMVIGADLLNEPDCDTGASLDNLYSKLSNATRSANRNITIFFEDYVGEVVENLGYGVSELPDPNSVYTFHLYRPSWIQAKELLDRFVQHGKALGVPMWLGEFDAFGSNRLDKPPQPAWQESTKRLFSYLRARHVSGWAYWAYLGGVGSVFEPNRRDVNTGLVKVLQSGFQS
jgi:aryl-phospho-beta-D-glucosidase BglC (GH1 family)